MVFNVLFNCMTLDISSYDFERFMHIAVYFLSFQNDTLHQYRGHLGWGAL